MQISELTSKVVIETLRADEIAQGKNTIQRELVTRTVPESLLIFNV